MREFKNITRFIGLSTLLVVLSGCANTGISNHDSDYKVVKAEIKRNYDTAVVANGKGKKHEIICVREKKTGSHVVKKVCRSKAQIVADRKRAQHDVNMAKTKGNVCYTCTGNTTEFGDR